MAKNSTMNSILIGIIALLVGSGVGFYAGTTYQKNKRPQFAQLGNGIISNRQGNGADAGMRFRNGGGGIAGEIIASDAASITVKAADGSSKIILVNDATSINKAAQGAKSDLVVGARIAAFGTTNADGSMTAQNIQLNPVMRGN